MQISEMKKRLLFMAFAAVDFFAAIEITSFIVAAPRVTEYFNIADSSISWIINSYLYVVFLALALFYFISKRIKHTTNIKAFFLFGLLLFFSGSILGSFATSIQMFYVARVIQGVGAALSFVGQLWVMTYSFKHDIGKPLFWTEIGAAAGVIAGPFLGGIFSDIATNGWRYLFAFNAVVVLAAMFFVYFLYHDRPKEVMLSAKKFRKDFYYAMVIIIATISVAVASEFVVSIFLQQFKDYSGMAAGFVLFSASLGLVFGSSVASKFKTKKQQQIVRGLWGMLAAVLFMGLALSWGIFFIAPISFFVVGFFYGFLSVVLYAYIAHMLPQNLLVKGITIYLIALQLGNASGIYVEKIWTFFGYDFFMFTVITVAAVFVALFFGAQLTNLENIEGDLYEIAPIAKTPFGLLHNLGSEIVNLLQALFYICIIIPFRAVMRIEVHGIEKVEIEDQMLIISNHGARLDAWIILAGLGLKNYMKLHPFRIPIAKIVYDIPILNILFKGTGMYKIESKGELDKSLEDTFRYIDKGHSILFFPEGRMMKKGETGDPKKGIMHIVKRKNIKMIPARIIYCSHNGRNRGNMWKARVIFGDSVHTKTVQDVCHEDNLHHVAMDYVHRLEIKIDKALNIELPLFTDVVREFSESSLESLLIIIKESFPSSWDYAESKEFYKNILSECDKNIVIFLREDRNIIGCLIAMPQNDAVADVKVDDPDMRKDNARCYVETIAVLPAYRKKFGHFSLVSALISENKKRNIHKYSMHVRRKNGLSKQIQALFGKEITEMRSLTWKWGHDEIIDYIEGAFSKPLWYLNLSFTLYRFSVKIADVFKR